MKRRLRFLFGGLAVYAAVIGFVPVLDHLVLFPSTRPLAAGSAVRQMIPFENGELELWVATSSAAEAKGKPDSLRPALLREC